MKTIIGLILTLVTCTGFAQTSTTAGNNQDKNKEGADLPTKVEQTDGRSRIIVRMYPNPTSGGITIEGFVVNAKSGYRICDAAGREVLRGNLNEGKNAIDVSTLLNGMYLVSITGDHETAVLRLVKQ